MMKIRSIFSSPIPRMPRIRSFRREGPRDLYINGRVDDDICRAYSTNAITLDELLDHLEVKVGHTKEIGRQVGDYRVCEDGQRIVWSAVYRVQRHKLAGGVSGHLTVFGKEMSQTAQGILLLPKDWVVRDARQVIRVELRGMGEGEVEHLREREFELQGRWLRVPRDIPNAPILPGWTNNDLYMQAALEQCGNSWTAGPYLCGDTHEHSVCAAMRDSSTWCNITIWGLASFISAPPNAHASEHRKEIYQPTFQSLKNVFHSTATERCAAALWDFDGITVQAQLGRPAKIFGLDG
ncbi:hypothetical protein B0H10DRAFT_1938748 [Mycena sp. CBHHK59/15]|nr:hypothetical protein B0H10DRAFT_1938748 [Mycena sp. CBHHK59/15]